VIAKITRISVVTKITQFKEHSIFEAQYMVQWKIDCTHFYKEGCKFLFLRHDGTYTHTNQQDTKLIE